jgi:hypothetical protein
MNKDIKRENSQKKENNLSEREIKILMEIRSK